MLVFFFQAEDGIRDKLVTGVQTCALPISTPAKPDNSPCTDTNACTQTDTCQSGTCVGSNPVVCTALDQCHAVGTCNPTIGVCSNPNKPNGTSCSDGNACTASDTCQSGSCAPGAAVATDDGNPCTTDGCDLV